jgi:hypothetical protein
MRALLALAVTSLAACSFDASGLALGLDGSVAGPPSLADASPAECQAECAAAGGVCQAGTCVITCDSSATCPGLVQCPPGLPCVVQCTGQNSCANGVACAGPASCEIDCTGRGSCNGGVACDGPSCIVRCTQQDSCGGGITCDATSCDLTCHGDKACQQGVCCSGASCGSSCNAGDNACCKCGGCGG